MDEAAKAPKSPWSVPVAVDDLPGNGSHVEIDASAEVRAQVLALVGGLSTVSEILSLSGVFDLTRSGSKVHVTGRVRAKIAQTCVVTLEPMESEIDEPVDLLFVPGHADAAQEEVEVSLEGEPAEPLFGDTVDLGTLATEFLVLGIDPYPRKNDVEFAPVTIGEEGPKAFAALAALKKRLGSGQN